jgi:hypothetical protein
MIAAGSQLQIHKIHIVLFAVWVAVFAVVYLHSRMRAAADAATSRTRLDASAWRARLLGIPGGIALCSIVAAGVHLSVIEDHFREALLYGLFFLLLTIAQFAFAAWIVWRPSRALFTAGAVAATAVVLLWLATRTTGIPLGPAAGETEPVGRLDLVASAAELAMAVLCFAAVRTRHGTRLPRHAPSAESASRKVPICAVDLRRHPG